MPVIALTPWCSFSIWELMRPIVLKWFFCVLFELLVSPATLCFRNLSGPIRFAVRMVGFVAGSWLCRNETGDWPLLLRSSRGSSFAIFIPFFVYIYWALLLLKTAPCGMLSVSVCFSF